MASSQLHYLSAAEAVRRIARRELSPVELLDASLARVQALDGALNSFITLLGDEARKVAKQREMEAAAGVLRGPLHGVPIGIKDIIHVKGVRTTAGSRIMADTVAVEDAEVLARLKRSGAIVVGKTNCHEFAWGGTNINPHYGACHNPWDLARIPGGSSGGSAAAVAAGLCAAALGSDTGGSIRAPAHFCGIVGIKPTLGRVSRHGVVPLSWSLDTVGPMTRTVEDAAILLGVMAGRDSKDFACSRRTAPDYSKALAGNIRGLRVGLPKRYFYEALDPRVERAVKAALAVLERLGAVISEVSFPSIDEAPSLGRVIMMSEASAFHDPWLRSRPQDYGADVRLRLEQGRLFLATDYVRAQQARTVISRQYASLLEQVDVLVTPTCPVPSPLIAGERIVLGGEQVDAHAVVSRFTRPFNLVGAPTISIPCGYTESGLPIGLQIAGRLFDEASVLRVAHAYEQACSWRERHPPI
ncbi:MAG: amidase [Chloroflexota bacterium]|nr:amidase [Chloroflexota bacterium]